jgi:hypothetical protein
MSRVIIFLGGIPGAGKTTLAAAIAAATGSLHIQASQLIRNGRVIVGERPEVADATDAELNQHFLVAAFEQILATHDRPILIDGHSSCRPRKGHTRSATAYSPSSTSALRRRSRSTSTPVRPGSEPEGRCPRGRTARPRRWLRCRGASALGVPKSAHALASQSCWRAKLRSPRRWRGCRTRPCPDGSQGAGGPLCRSSRCRPRVELRSMARLWGSCGNHNVIRFVNVMRLPVH